MTKLNLNKEVKISRYYLEVEQGEPEWFYIDIVNRPVFSGSSVRIFESYIGHEVLGDPMFMFGVEQGANCKTEKAFVKLVEKNAAEWKEIFTKQHGNLV